jgi:hypothetical protein
MVRALPLGIVVATDSPDTARMQALNDSLEREDALDPGVAVPRAHDDLDPRWRP